MNLEELEKVLQKSWSIETSYCPNEWNESNSSFGQCAVSALIVDDYFGGEIIWAEASLPDGQKISHYFNCIDGKEVDLTRHQFSHGTTISSGAKKNKGFATMREFMLSNENTKKRYELLKEIVRNKLAD